MTMESQLNTDLIHSATSLLAGEKHLLEMTSRNAPLLQILNALCYLVEQNIVGCRCSIVVLDSSGKQLQLCVAPNLPKTYNDFLLGQEVQLEGGPCAIAARLKQQVVIADISEESGPQLQAWCQHALQHKLHACWSTPILSSVNTALGSFAIYYEQPHHPAEQQQYLIEQFVHLAGIAIERKQAAAALQASEKLARDQVQALTNMLDSLAQEAEPEKLIEHVLRTITTQLGALSACVWLQESGAQLMTFAYGFEQNRLVDRNDVRLNSIFPVLDLQQHWPHLRQSRQPEVLSNIRNVSDFPCRQHQLELGVISMLIIPLLISGQVEGILAIGFSQSRQFLAEDLVLSQALAHQTMLVLQLSRLSMRSREAAVMAERCRLARDIHDTLAQGMTGVILQLEAAADVLSCGQAGQLGQHLQRANHLARQSLQDAKRSVQALRPMALENKNLSVALRELCKVTLAGQNITLQYTEQGTVPALSSQLEDNVLRIVQEVLTNCLRYAGASEFSLNAFYAASGMQLILQDNGCGFDLNISSDGYGLIGIHERAQLMGGEVQLNTAPGAGTRLELRLPLYPHHSEADNVSTTT